MINGAPSGQAALDAELGRFGPNALTVRLIDALLNALPIDETIEPWRDTQGCCSHHGASTHLDAIRARWAEPEVGRALFTARSLDAGDTGITVVTGIRTALSLFMKDGGPGVGADAQQQADAALKALGLSFIVASLIPGTPEQRVQRLKHLPTGRALLTTYAAVEMALPLHGGTHIPTVRAISEARGKQIAGKLMGVIGRSGLDEAQATLDALIDTLDASVRTVAPHTTQLADTLGAILPKVVHRKGGALADVVAAGADALPIYRYLCSRLATESAVLQTVWLNEPERAPETADDTPPKAASPAIPTEPPSVPDALAAVAAGPPPVPDALRGAAAAPDATQPSKPTGEHDLGGVWLHETPTGQLWLCFTKDGLFSNAPPIEAKPDWVAHAEAGHAVGTYQRSNDVLTIHWPSGAEATAHLERDTYALTVDGRVFDRADYALTGITLDGTWRERSGEGTLTLHPDGTFSHPQGQGRYALGTGAIALGFADGSERTHSFLSTLQPETAHPETIWLAGRPWDRVA